MIRGEQSEGRPKQGSLYLLTGVIIGVVIGLIFSLAIAPLRYKDATPEILDSDSQIAYKVLIAQAYAAEKDMGRVQVRWGAFGVDNLQVDLHTLLSELSASEGYNANAVALDYLLYDLRGGSGENQNPAEETETKPTETPDPEESSQIPGGTEVALAESTAVSAEESPPPLETTPEEESAQSTETQPPIPTNTVVAALSKPFQLEERLVLCEENQPGLLQIQVKDDDGSLLQGVPILISWSGGSEVFYTGLFPAFNDGYADYEMDENETYRVQVGESGVIVDGVRVNVCEREDGSTFAGGWWLSFQP